MSSYFLGLVGVSVGFFLSLLCARVRHTLVSWKGCILKVADEAELLVQGYDIFFFI